MYANTVHFWTVYSSARTQAIPGKTVHIWVYVYMYVYMCCSAHHVLYII